jgi:hypothetical protein
MEDMSGAQAKRVKKPFKRRKTLTRFYAQTNHQSGDFRRHPQRAGSPGKFLEGLTLSR